ncbi:MAG: hypothetical protein WAU48_13535 [Gammaproteobacteria bacterium]
MSTRHPAIVLLSALLLGACGGGGGSGSAVGPAPVAPGTLAIVSNPRPVPAPVPQDYLDAVDLGRRAGSRGAAVTWRWSELETAPGVVDLSDVAANLNFYNSVRPSTIYVGIQPINTIPREVPADLGGVAFDDPQMLTRFHSMLDQLLTLFAGRVTYLSIGNEVDVYLEAHPDEVTAYRTFYAEAVAYVHSRDPAIKVGVTATFSGATGSAGVIISSLNQLSDVIMLTYYPLGAGFAVRDPGVVASDFPLMLGLDPAKPVLLQEVGYPAAALLGSSDARQADFVRNVFQAWRNSGTRIPFLSFFLMHDFTPELCDVLGDYYGLPGSDAFKAYLCTLGLRHTDGSARPAWQVLVDEARSAGLPVE